MSITLEVLGEKQQFELTKVITKLTIRTLQCITHTISIDKCLFPLDYFLQMLNYKSFDAVGEHLIRRLHAGRRNIFQRQESVSCASVYNNIIMFPRDVSRTRLNK